MNTWYSIKVFVDNDAATVFSGKESAVQEELFEGGVGLPEENNPEKMGRAGLMTWGTAAGFDRIVMKPEDDD